MKIHSINVNEILISKTRQRKAMSEDDVIKLASSISQIGLIHPVIVRQDEDGNYVLVAGERRIRAMTHIWFFGQKVKCGEFEFDEEQVPCIFQGEMDSLDAMEMELEENIRRIDLSWQDRARATSELAQLKNERAKAEGRDPPTIEEIAAETHGTGGEAATIAKAEILVTPHLADPDLEKATSAKEALKILKRKEESQRNAEVAARIGKSLVDFHVLLQGECISQLSELKANSFDVVLTDPPYGIDADKFGDSGGHAGGGTDGSHFYDDSWTSWNILMRDLLPELFRITKPQAHLYLFCDIDNFVILRDHAGAAGWKVFRTPLVWVNPTANRVPWVECGPMRIYQLILYAIKGSKPVNQIYKDVLTYPSDDNLGHPAQKPVALYQDLLNRSAKPGDSVIDPFGGTGTILPAAHEARCKATYIEQDPAAFGIAVKRLEQLK